MAKNVARTSAHAIDMSPRTRLVVTTSALLAMVAVVTAYSANTFLIVDSSAGACTTNEERSCVMSRHGYITFERCTIIMVQSATLTVDYWDVGLYDTLNVNGTAYYDTRNPNGQVVIAGSYLEWYTDSVYNPRSGWQICGTQCASVSYLKYSLVKQTNCSSSMTSTCAFSCASALYYSQTSECSSFLTPTQYSRGDCQCYSASGNTQNATFYVGSDITRIDFQWSGLPGQSALRVTSPTTGQCTLQYSYGVTDSSSSDGDSSSSSSSTWMIVGIAVSVVVAIAAGIAVVMYRRRKRAATGHRAASDTSGKSTVVAPNPSMSLNPIFVLPDPAVVEEYEKLVAASEALAAINQELPAGSKARMSELEATLKPGDTASSSA